MNRDKSYVKNHIVNISEKIRNNKGSITSFTLLSMMFFMIVVIAIYIGVSNKVQKQEKELNAIQKSYEQKETINDIYEKEYDDYINSGTTTIQVYADTTLKGEIKGQKKNTIGTVYTNIAKTKIKLLGGINNKYAYSETVDGKKVDLEGNEFTIEATTSGKTIYTWVKGENGEYTKYYTAVVVKLSTLQDKTIYVAEGKSVDIGEIKGVNSGKITFDKIDTNMITVKDNIVTGIKAGDTTIIAIESNGGAQSTITIKIVKLTLEKTKEITLVGVNKTIQVSGINNGALKVKSSDETIAKVIISGTQVTINPQKVGNAKITITEQNAGASIDYEIQVANITLAPNGGKYTMPTIGKATIKTQVKVENANKIEVAWTSTNLEWKTIENNSEVSKKDCEKGTYYLYVKIDNEYIYQSEVFTIGNNIITITLNTTAWTKENIVGTIQYPDSTISSTRKAGYGLTLSNAQTAAGSATAPTTSVTATDNGYIFATATDNAGNVITASKQITNIDRNAPTKPTIEARLNNERGTIYNSSWTNNNVYVKVTSTDSGSGIDHYEWYDKGAWTTSTLTTNNGVGTITYTLERNATIRFRAIDKVGNISEEGTIIIKIDKTLPTVTLSPNGGSYAKPTSGNATIKTTLTANDTGGSALKTLQYAWSTSNTTEPTTWTTFTNGATVSKTDCTAGTYYLWTKVVDNAGNRATNIKTSSGFVVETKNIIITLNTTAWTKENVVGTIQYPDSTISSTRKAGYGLTLSNAQTAAGSATAPTTSVTATDNGYIFATATDNAGNVITASKQITNIDRNAPTITTSEIKNVTTTGYDVYVYGVKDVGSGVNRVQFPTWTELNGQDDIQSNWTQSSLASGKLQSDGTTWVYHVNVTDHKNEAGTYYTHVYTYDNLGNFKVVSGPKIVIPTVTITFDENYNSVKTKIEKAYNTQLGPLSTPTRTGYTFAGWYTAPTGGTQISNTTLTPAVNTTYYAHWTANNYTINYNGNGATSGSTASSSHKYDTAKNLTANGFLKTGYTFQGWSTNASATIPTYGNLASVKNLTATANGTVTLYAIWKDTTSPTMTTPTISPTGWTNGNVILTAKAIDSGSGINAYQWNTKSGITSSSGGWTQITNTKAQISQKYTATANGTYYFYAKDASGNVGVTSIKVSNIDRIAPNASIKLNSTSGTTIGSITATVTQSDSQSGVKISNCKWVYNTTAGKIGTNASSYTGGTFTSTTQNLTLKATTPGTYYLHVLTVDNVGNAKETISEAATVEPSFASKVSVGDYVAYNATNNYSYTSPKGTGMSHGNGYQDQKFTSSSSIKWRVLSKDTSTGEVVLISEKPVGTEFYMKGAIGYLYAEQELNEICKIYGHGVGANTSKTFTYEIGDPVDGIEFRLMSGSGARSINVDDINKILGYTPPFRGTFTKSAYYPTRMMDKGYFTWAESRTYEITELDYDIYEVNSSLTETMQDIIHGSNGGYVYWLADASQGLGPNFNVQFMDGSVVTYSTMFDGKVPSEWDNYMSVRPIVYLKTNVQTIGKNSSGAWTIVE